MKTDFKSLDINYMRNTIFISYALIYALSYVEVKRYINIYCINII